jgi:hypothetical protein
VQGRKLAAALPIVVFEKDAMKEKISQVETRMRQLSCGVMGERETIEGRDRLRHPEREPSERW